MRFQSAVLISAVVTGVLIGIGAYTFVYAKGYSYLTNDPSACANCHIMREHYEAWTKASHRAVAVCNDCHTPPGLVPKYMTKARNGFWHSFYFTSGRYADPLRITPRNHTVTELACRTCHEEITASIDTGHAGRDDRGISCIRCHATVGHLE
jgi:cytochrome c nitrite reductase small subunit